MPKGASADKSPASGKSDGDTVTAAISKHGTSKKSVVSRSAKAGLVRRIFILNRS